MTTDPFHGAMDLAERRTADRKINEARRDSRRDYLRYVEEAAEADLQYRKGRAKKLVELRAEGEPAGVAEICAEAEVAEFKMRAKLGDGMAKEALLRIDEAERHATSVRDIHSSSERAEGLAA